MHRIEVCIKQQLPDSAGQGLLKGISDLGINNVSDVRVIDVYWLDAELEKEELELICKRLLADPITQDYSYDSTIDKSSEDGLHSIEVAYNAGVADPVEETAMKAVKDLGIDKVKAIKTAKRYLIKGNLDKNDMDIICGRLLVNPIIQHIVGDNPVVFSESPRYKFKLKHIDILNADDNSLNAIAAEFGFNKNEMQAIKEYYSRLGRNPIDAELETLAQTWSEHCCHKTFKGKINFNGEIIDNLLKSTIARATKELDKPWCLSVFKDNAGVIEFDDEWALCFKVETHNHPSAIEPYGGASTGVGGVVRDILGTGLSAKPIFNTDVFCFGNPDMAYEDVPEGVLHPRRMLKGVRAGVADYGNRLGIPTGNGAICFDKRYTANPLVYCGTVGLMPKKYSQMGKQKAGDLIVLAGGRTGRDGIHGVTFASEQLDKDSTEVSFSSVQIGNPIVEKKLIDTILQARDKELFVRITDCGGGGLSSAVGEMGAETGAKVYLDRVPLKYAGLSYSEIWISESQERMIMAVPPDKADELLKLFADENTEATVIGEFTGDKRLQLFYNDNLVCDLDMEFLHEGHPQLELKALWCKASRIEPKDERPDIEQSLLKILGSWNVCSREWIIRQYDHEVQGGSVLKPLVGKNNDGPGDAAIIKPVLDSDMGVIVSNGINSKYSDIDPYWMAASAIDEALRQIISVGGSLERVALLDNFCWGNTNKPERMGTLALACQACYDMSVAFGAPFISGKDSLNNEFHYRDTTIAIPDTLLISAMAVMKDSSKAVSMDFKKNGDFIYIVGNTYNELGGSEYYKSIGYLGNDAPKVNPQQAKKTMDNLSKATEKRLVKACHDLSEGGLGVAAAEMAFAGNKGAKINLDKVPLGEKINRDDYILFSESNSRFLVEIAQDDADDFEKTLNDVPFACIGEVTSTNCLQIFGLNQGSIINIELEKLKQAWQKPLDW
ncbi:MAG: phosphoribosylformylglycinamidine synthase subunit PurL [Dehalococcoidales bacterium]|nr:phosphoribosylformylglycinamidine synthase subunit PurL [Dehalococcoidales bacterium]